jgi:2-oxoglutarate dehydrogenase complex dehydrogenase (E1) component-like enzyme
MGAWGHIALNHSQYNWKCSARRAAASPATGFPKAHEKEQADLVAAAFA